jgi:hypothetical protein
VIWRKYGRIFIPEKYGIEYAKSPQAVVFHDFVRIYFSACRHDKNKLISYVCLADFTKDFSDVLNVQKQIIPDGALGCFDEHGIFPFSPLQFDNKICAYTSGWSRRVSVSVDTGIGIAVSEDGGKSFHRLGDGPVMSSSLDEPFLVIDAFVRWFEDRFHMWYIYGKEWKQYKPEDEPERIYKIGHAVSHDGIDWRRDGMQIIPDRIKDESQALPCVIFFNNQYHMFFCYRYSYDFRNNENNTYRLGYACSDSLNHWNRCDEKLNFPIAEDEWDSQMQCYPNIFEMDGKLYLLYNGNEFGKNGFGLAELEKL